MSQGLRDATSERPIHLVCIGLSLVASLNPWLIILDEIVFSRFLRIKCEILLEFELDTL